jgi:glycosyltransferase involved in cell wall biosynthesis
MKRILYVVHRYAPYPGGSENYVRDMAEETAGRGHEVAVFTVEHKGDWNGIRVSGDPQILLENWDLIVVHGSGVSAQDFVHQNSSVIPSDILYMLILPSHTPLSLQALKNSKYVGCSSLADWEHVEKYGVSNKSVEIRHSINPKISIGKPGFKEKYGIKTDKMFMSAGGFWQHKGFEELIDSFNKTNLTDTTLVLTGYDNRSNLMPATTEFVKPFLIDDRDDVMSAISEADLYVLNSYEEGFGLVLLESMLNNTPWAARNIAGAATMREYGFTYDTQDQLIEYMKNFNRLGLISSNETYDYVVNNRMISNTVDDIMSLLK